MHHLIYDNYKEPLRANESGYGYLGTVAYTKDGSSIQCYECGKLFSSIVPHVIKHGLTTREYKQKYQISLRTPLISRKLREAKIKTYKETITKEINTKAVEGLRKYRADVKSGKRKYINGRKGWSLEKRNKMGTCPDQLIDKLQKLTDENNGHIGYRKLAKDYGGFLRSLITTFGNLTNARKAAGLINHGYSVMRYSEEYLLEAMRDFYKLHGRTPTISDFKAENGLPDYKNYHKHYGGINRARLMAGVPIIIQVGQRQFVEVKVDDLTSSQLQVIMKT